MGGELKSDINVYYMAQTTQPIFVGQEYIVEPMCEEYDEVRGTERSV